MEQSERAGEEVRRAIEELERGAEAGVGEWRALWEPVGIVAGSPEEMSAWRDDYLSLEGAIAGLDERNSALRAVEESISVQVLALRSACEILGRAPESDRLQHLVDQAQAIIDEAGTIVDGRRGIEAALRQANDQRSARSKDLARAEQDLEKWRTAWLAALDVLGLSARPFRRRHLKRCRIIVICGPPDEIRVFDVRITGMKRDMDDFRSSVDDAARELEEVRQPGVRARSRRASTRGSEFRVETRREEKPSKSSLRAKRRRCALRRLSCKALSRSFLSSVRRRESGRTSLSSPSSTVRVRSRDDVSRSRTSMGPWSHRELDGDSRDPQEVSEIGMSGDELVGVLGSIDRELEDLSGAVDLQTDGLARPQANFRPSAAREKPPTWNRTPRKHWLAPSTERTSRD